MTDREFVLAWEASDSLDELASRLKLKPRRASTIASVLRAAGVRLKMFRRGPRAQKRDVKALNRLVAK